ncbi:MAG: hypothetical protein V2I97_04635, partial [Desulfococcaceae bacterium]|nr:hypothetical protein [Desulfococcaceae bacterium]
MSFGLMSGKSQIRYGTGRPWNVRHGVLSELHSEAVPLKHAGIYGNHFLLITADVLSAAQISGKVMPLFFPQN